MDNINPTTITDRPARSFKPETRENIPIKVASYPRAAAWLAAGCPARFDVRTVVNLQPATSEPATGGQ